MKECLVGSFFLCFWKLQYFQCFSYLCRSCSQKQQSHQHLMRIWAEQEICGGAAVRRNTQRSQWVKQALTAALGVELQATQVMTSYICHLSWNPSFHNLNHVYPGSGDINWDGSNCVDVFWLLCSISICWFKDRP